MNENYEKILRQKGINPKTANGADVDKLIKGLSPEDAKKLNQILSNKQQLNEVLNSDKAKQMMRLLFGDK